MCLFLLNFTHFYKSALPVILPLINSKLLIVCQEYSFSVSFSQDKIVIAVYLYPLLSPQCYIHLSLLLLSLNVHVIDNII